MRCFIFCCLAFEDILTNASPLDVSVTHCLYYFKKFFGNVERLFCKSCPEVEVL